MDSSQPIKPEPSTSPHSCPHCHAIIINPPPQPSPHSYSHRHRLPHTPSSALRATKDGCPIFTMLLKGYLFARQPKELRMLIRAVQGEPDIRLPRAGVFGPKERIIYFAESLSKRPFSVRFDGKGRALFACMAWGSLWFNVNAAPTDPASEFFPVRPINRDVASTGSFDLARTWLDECVNHGAEAHRLCPSAKDIKFTPTRLLEIMRDEGQYRIKLRETRPQEHLKYACLSYCWGGDQPVKTTKATLAQPKQNIDFTTLPKTLQDAILVTHRLRCSFLWIDALCIIQDDAGDLATELPQMPEIYKNAWVTISASSARSCFEGFLQQRRPSPDVQCEDITLRYECPNGEMGHVYMFQDAGRTALDPIDERAWTLQERRISPRVLDCRSDQLRWKCKSRAYFDGGYASENLEEAGPRSGDSSSKRSSPADEVGTGVSDNDSKRSSPADEDARSSSNTREALVKEMIFKKWPDIIDDYTQRTLSFPSDKLVALAALASEVGTPLNIPYRAGLWNAHLPAQLLWRLWGSPVARPAQYRAPSWSWASVDGWVMTEHSASSARTALEIVECTTELVNPGFAHGAVKSGSLIVKGRLLTAFWFVNREGGLAVEGLRDEDDESEASFEASDDEEMTDASDADGSDGDDDEASWDTTSDAVDASFLSGVDVSADAVESDWDRDDPDFVVEVRCLQVMKQVATDGAAGLLLIPDCSSANTVYTRLGHFFFESRKNDLFAGAEEQVITIV